MAFIQNRCKLAILKTQRKHFNLLKMKTLLITLCLLTVLSISAQIPQGYSLKWSDEFNGTQVDTTNWTFEIGDHGWGNNELQYYTAGDNATVADGVLKIIAKKENGRYTSTRMVTRDKKIFTYGYFEIRAILPQGTGTWPAIWMLGNNIPQVGWPACGEIDIMENVGYDPDTIHANIHTKAYNHVMKTNKGNRIGAVKPYENYNVYAVEWFEDHMDFFLNDSLYFSFKNEGTGNDVWPFDKPHYLIINLAIGGGWGGQKGIDEAIFPQKYYIDYVRVYQRKK